MIDQEALRRRERAFVGSIVLLVALVGVFVIAPAQAAECHSADKAACEDLLHAEITFEKVGIKTFESVCGYRAEACAVVNMTANQCTIYYSVRRLSPRAVTHEMNHCRGWFHVGNLRTSARRPWVDHQTHLGG